MVWLGRALTIPPVRELIRAFCLIKQACRGSGCGRLITLRLNGKLKKLYDGEFGRPSGKVID
jgi:hypothetical protein